MKSRGSLRFENISAVSAEHLELIRSIRNHRDIRKYMYTDHVISPDEHLRWIEGLAGDETRQVFVVFARDTLVGLVSLSKISAQHRTADWAFYLDPGKHSGGLGVQVEYSLLEYAFTHVGVEKLNCEVLDINPAVVKLHKKFGFREEGFRRSNIIKDGQRIGVYLLGLTSSEWDVTKSRFEKIMSRHEG